MGTGGTGGTSSGGTDTGGTGGTNSGGSGTGGMAPADCGTMTGSGAINDRYGVLMVTRNGLEYIVQNNVWGSSSALQTLQVAGTTFTVTQQTGDNAASVAPVSYPSIFVGSNNSHTSANSGLPRAVSSLGPVTTSLSHNADGSIAGIYNAAYDVWFSTTSAGDPNSPSGGYLMVWLYDPPQKQPVGGLMAAGQTISGADGTWNVYTSTGSGTPVISYVRTQSTTSITFDLNAFIRHAVLNYPSNISNAWYLTNIFGGFEIWSGGVGLKITCFWVNIG
jgi:hypothetical protein